MGKKYTYTDELIINDWLIIVIYNCIQDAIKHANIRKNYIYG